jgi:Flp pilus assembly protein TadG
MNIQSDGPSPSWGLRFARSIHDDNAGGTAVEFALVLPMTAILLFAIIKFGIVLNNQIQLTHAASAAARQLSISRGSTTPYSSTIAAMRLSAPTLKSASIGSAVTLTDASNKTTTCTADDTTCQNAFGNGSGAVQAKVVLSYPCNLNLPFIALPNCSLSTSAAGLVQ